MKSGGGRSRRVYDGEERWILGRQGNFPVFPFLPATSPSAHTASRDNPAINNEKKKLSSRSPPPPTEPRWEMSTSVLERKCEMRATTVCSSAEYSTQA